MNRHAILGVPVRAALAVCPGRTAEAVMEKLSREPHWGLSLDEVQICPQNRGLLSTESVTALRNAYPGTRFRLHANARVAGWTSFMALANSDRHPGYFRTLSQVSNALKAPAYTLHPGVRQDASWKQLGARLESLTDLMGIPVGVEGMYPTPTDRYLLSTWPEYRQLLESGWRYALDLSHVNVMTRNQAPDSEAFALLKDLVAAPQCIEIHVSDNDGERDSHVRLERTPWWQSLLSIANPHAVIFSEEHQPPQRM